VREVDDFGIVGCCGARRGGGGRGWRLGSGRRVRCTCGLVGAGRRRRRDWGKMWERGEEGVDGFVGCFGFGMG